MSWVKFTKIGEGYSIAHYKDSREVCLWCHEHSMMAVDCAHVVPIEVLNLYKYLRPGKTETVGYFIERNNDLTK